MSAQTDELDNVIASLTNINAALKAQEANVPVAPEVPAPAEPVVEPPIAPEVPVAAPEAPVETPAEEAAEEASEQPPDIAPNTPSANITVG